MFGWIHESLRQLVTRKYGQEAWLKILELANLNEPECEIAHYYKDEETMRLVQAVANVIGIPVEEVWEAYGSFLIHFTMETGWDELLRVMARNLEGFLDGLDSLHYFIDHVVYQTRLSGPSFRCEPQTDGTLRLHYYSKRNGLYPIVIGLVREVARRIYDTEVVMKVHERKQEHIDSFVTEHVVFVITEVQSGVIITHSIANNPPTNILPEANSGFNGISLNDFCSAFPHHMCFDKELRLEHFGSYIKKAYPWCKRHETNLTDILELIHPEVPLTFESIMVFKNSQFVCKLKDIDGQESNVKAVMVKGSMTIVDNGQFMVYLCSLYVTTVRELIDRNLHLSDIQGHDGTRDLIMLNQSRLSQVELNRRLEETTKNLKRMASELETEKHKTDELLSQLMPISVAEALRQGTSVEACEFAEATLLFTDIVTFTNICAQCTPYDVVTLLNDLYLRFDRLVGLHDVYKVETIGDAYMIVGGVPNKCANHAERVLNVSIGTIMESKSVMSPITNRHIQIRAGVHTGAVVAGVVGIKMPRYCLFGDAVNTANRMESCGIPGRIHVSDPTKKAALQMNPSFVFADRGNVEIKGKGTMHTYFLERNDRKSVWEICNRQRGANETIDGYMELHDQTAYTDDNKKASMQGNDKRYTGKFKRFMDSKVANGIKGNVHVDDDTERIRERRCTTRKFWRVTFHAHRSSTVCSVQ